MSRWTRLMEMAKEYSNDVDALLERTTATQQTLQDIGDGIAAHGAALQEIRGELGDMRRRVDDADALLDAMESLGL